MSIQNRIKYAALTWLESYADWRRHFTEKYRDKRLLWKYLGNPAQLGNDISFKTLTGRRYQFD